MPRRNAATNRLMRELKKFEESDFRCDHAGRLLDCCERMREVIGKIDIAVEERLSVDSRVAKELEE